jgi:hypothetical protein
MEFLFIIALLVLLALASLRWGVDSRKLNERWFPHSGDQRAI